MDKKKIFIADDDEAVLFTLKNLLIDSGYDVESTSKPKEILGKIKQSKPSVVILDLLMPDLGGFEICEMLNEDEETRGIPIIIVSALADSADVKRAYALGVVGYLSKPYDYKKLIHEINKAISYKEGAL